MNFKRKYFMYNFILSFHHKSLYIINYKFVNLYNDYFKSHTKDNFLLLFHNVKVFDTDKA